jgi:hypothetical protein
MTDELSITIGSDVQPGTYTGTLVDLEPFEIEVDGEQRPLYRWTFAIEDGEAGQTVEGISSRSQSPRGKAAQWIAALTADSDVLGRSFRKSDLIGREALVSIEADANGYPKVAGLVSVPKAGKGKSA